MPKQPDLPVATQVRGFLEQHPLYSKIRLSLPEYFSQMQPDVVELRCPVCKTSRPFRDSRPYESGAGMGGPPPLSSGVYKFYFNCTGCHSATYQFFVEVNVQEGWIRKVGQAPPWEITIPSDLEDELGVSATYYKRALICMSQSYGLAACAYLRRVLEDHINPLLHLLLDFRREAGAPETELEEIQATIRSKAFDSKIELAYNIVPPSIIVDGINPLKLIHDKLSIGVHRLTEDECMEIALSLSSSFAYVIRELNRQRQAKAEFTQGIRAVAQLKK